MDEYIKPLEDVTAPAAQKALLMAKMSERKIARLTARLDAVEEQLREIRLNKDEVNDDYDNWEF